MKKKPEHISQEDGDDVDSPPLTDEMMAKMRPHKELFPDWPDRITLGPHKEPKKVPVSIRFSPEMVEYFKSSGKGWQSRLNQALCEYVDAHEPDDPVVHCRISLKPSLIHLAMSSGGFFVW